MPILGEQGKAIGESYAKASDDPSFVNISETVGQTAFGLGTAFGGAGLARGAGVKRAYQTPRSMAVLTGETSSGSVTVDAQSIKAGSQTVFSGHGGYEIGSGITTIPDGTSLTVYSKFGATISDRLGNMIETGENLSNVYRRTYGPGERLPNYTLYPPEDLTIKGNPVTVDGPTQISNLMKPGMGECHWAACTHNPKSINAGHMYDKSGIVDLNKYNKYIQIYSK